MEVRVDLFISFSKPVIISFLGFITSWKNYCEFCDHSINICCLGIMETDGYGY